MALTRARLAQVNTTVASLQDPITLINRGADTANVDVGFVFNRDGGSNSNVAIIWDETNDIFTTVFTDSTGGTNSNINVVNFANLKINNLFANIGGGTSQANIYVTGSLLPSANVTYDLGSATNRFKTLWLAGNTLDIGGETISVGESGTWNFSSNGTVISLGHSAPFNPVSINSTSGTFTILTTTGTTVLANTSGNTVVASTTQSTGATLGALVVKGGVGIAKDLWVDGNLIVAGTSTTLNTATLDVTDLNVTLAKGAPTAFAADGAGITIDGAGATLLYNNANDAFDFNKVVRGPGLYLTTANVTTGNIVTADVVTLNASTGNITTLTGSTVNVQSTTSTVLNVTTANIGSTITASGNIVAASGTESVSTTTGAVVVVGGVGASGNVTASKLYTGGGLFWSANGVSALSAAGTTASTSPPGSAKYGDLWYNTATDVVYQYLNDGVSDYWIDISSQTIAANTSNVVSGNLSITGTYQVGGKQAVNGPAFRAYIATEQAITSGSQQKVTFGTETFDTNSNFSSSRFTPTIEGYYQLNATVRIEGNSGTGECMITIWKNGSEYARGTNEQGTEQGANWYSMQVSDLAYANGTGDYFEIYIQQGSGGNRNTTAGTNISYFSGAMVRGA